MIKEIVFDLDGTVVDFYNVPNWLEMIRAFDPTPYRVAEPMWNMNVLASVLKQLQKNGIEITIVTWHSKESTPEFDKATREAKLQWLAQYDFPYDHFHCVRYGATKANSVRKYLKDGEAILIDDNKHVREGWHLGATIDPTTENIIEVLKELVNYVDCQ